MSDVLPYLLGGFLGAATWDVLSALLRRRRRPPVKVTRLGPSSEPIEVRLLDLAPYRTVLTLDDGARLMVVRVSYRNGDEGRGVTLDLIDERDLRSSLPPEPPSRPAPRPSPGR